jgi:8-amino-7-oxononanoate synthase
MTGQPAETASPPEALAVLRAAAAGRQAAGLNRALTPRAAGRRGPLDLASNDYLGLTADPRLAEAAAAAARDWGPGSTGSRLVTGTTELHHRLEAELATFAGVPRALVFSSGYLANLAVVTALAQVLGQDGDGVLIVSDAANHASLIDACRLARARGVRVEVTPHADVAAMELVLAQRPERHALVISDTVFSVAGDLAPVRDLHRVARAHRALLVLDEAHAFGVLGPDGRGAAAAAGIAADPQVVRTFTLSKSLGSQGGAVAGAAEVIETLVDVGRGFIFDTGLAPPSAAAALAALAILRDEPGLGQRARDHARRLAAGAAELGFSVGEPAAAVVRVLVGAAADAVQARDVCTVQGVQVGCFRPPSVPAGQACLRLTARANLSEVHLALAFRALGSVRDHVRITA